MNESFKIQLNNAERAIKDQQSKAGQDKQLFELQVIR